MKLCLAILGRSCGKKKKFWKQIFKDWSRKLPHKGDVTCLAYHIFQHSWLTNQLISLVLRMVQGTWKISHKTIPHFSFQWKVLVYRQHVPNWQILLFNNFWKSSSPMKEFFYFSQKHIKHSQHLLCLSLFYCSCCKIQYKRLSLSI